MYNQRLIAGFPTLNQMDDAYTRLRNRASREHWEINIYDDISAKELLIVGQNLSKKDYDIMMDIIKAHGGWQI